MARSVFRVGAASLFAGILAMGCSHAWDVLEPLPGSTATGTGGASASSSGGLGGAGGAGSTTSTAQGPGSAASSSSSASSTSAVGSTTASASSSSAEASSSAAASSSASTGGGSTVSYPSQLAACNSDQDLDILDCEMLSGGSGMYIDVMSDLGLVEHAFMAFDLDATLAGKTIDAVTLRLTVMDGGAADSVNSGSIWQVMPFDKASLAMAQPANIGPAVSPDLGPVALSTDYYWPIPTSLVAPSTSVYLSVQSDSTDGVRYWNDHGNKPPALIVDYH